MDAFQQAGFAGGIGAGNKIQPATERQLCSLDIAVIPYVERQKPREAGWRRFGRGGNGSQLKTGTRSQRRMGMTT